MKITTRHPASSYGIPVILNDLGIPMDYPDGVKAVLKRLRWTSRVAAEKSGITKRTVDAYRQGTLTPPSAAFLNVLGDALHVSAYVDAAVELGMEARLEDDCVSIALAGRPDTSTLRHVDGILALDQDQFAADLARQDELLRRLR